VEVAARGELMPRVRTDGFNENQIEAEPAGKGEHRIGVALVVSRAIFPVSSDFLLMRFIRFSAEIWRYPSAQTFECGTFENLGTSYV